MVSRLFLVVVLAFISLNTWSEESELTVMFGISRPPFISEAPPSGISYELFELISSRLDWAFKPVFAPNQRMDLELANMHVDAIVEVQKNNDELFFSDPYIAYRNYAVSRTRDQLDFKDYSDLEGYSVCAWQNATKNLGSSFEKEIPSFREYKEYPLQEKQVRSWLSTQCEVIIIDDTLLKWWINLLAPSFTDRHREVDKEIVFAPLPNNKLWWYVAFKHEAQRDQFNAELQKIRANGEYDKIREQVLLERE